MRNSDWCAEDVREYFGEYLKEGITDEELDNIMDIIERRWEEFRVPAEMPTLCGSSFTQKMNMVRWVLTTLIGVEGIPFKARYLRAEYIVK